MFENKTVKVGNLGEVHISRIIASWRNKGGDTRSDEFEEWLHELNLTADEISDIMLFANNGKLELEMFAREFMAIKGYI